MKGRMKRALDRYSQQQLGITHYIWRSQDDSRVRAQHAAYDDKLFAWAKPPKGGHSGEAFNCRCYAEPAADNAGLPTLDTENQFDVAGFGPVIRLILNQMAKRVAKAPKPKLPKKPPKPPKNPEKPSKPKNPKKPDPEIVKETAKTIAETGANIKDAEEAIEKYLGGKGERITNKHGDTIIIKGDKKIRFDVNNTGGDKPHFHIEQRTPSGKWKDAGERHRYYFED